MTELPWFVPLCAAFAFGVGLLCFWLVVLHVRSRLRFLRSIGGEPALWTWTTVATVSEKQLQLYDLKAAYHQAAMLAAEADTEGESRSPFVVESRHRGNGLFLRAPWLGRVKIVTKPSANGTVEIRLSRPFQLTIGLVFILFTVAIKPWPNALFLLLYVALYLFDFCGPVSFMRYVLGKEGPPATMPEGGRA